MTGGLSKGVVLYETQSNICGPQSACSTAFDPVQVIITSAVKSAGPPDRLVLVAGGTGAGGGFPPDLSQWYRARYPQPNRHGHCSDRQIAAGEG